MLVRIYHYVVSNVRVSPPTNENRFVGNLKLVDKLERTDNRAAIEIRFLNPMCLDMNDRFGSVVASQHLSTRAAGYGQKQPLARGKFGSGLAAHCS